MNQVTSLTGLVKDVFYCVKTRLPVDREQLKDQNKTPASFAAAAIVAVFILTRTGLIRAFVAELESSG